MGSTAVWKLLAEWGIDNPTEEDVWEAIAELDEHKQDYYEDGDLTEWLQIYFQKVLTKKPLTIYPLMRQTLYQKCYRKQVTND